MKKNRLNGIGLNPNVHPHYMDHLAIICIIMGIPLLVTDEVQQDLAKKQYPGLKILVEDWENFTPDYLIRNYDVLFQCDLWPRKEFYELFLPLEKKYQKQIRNVHCPHGFSDKGFWLEKVADEDITLLYGQNMIDLLEERKMSHKIGPYVVTGNYRYTYFKEHFDFFQKFVQEEVLQKFENPKLPLLFYAPTWQDQEFSSSFFQAAPDLLKKIPKSEFNLLVKLHPRLEENNPLDVDRILYPYQNHPQILFVNHLSLIYPLLSIADAYIGDASSIGYDFLIFDKPMFFLNSLDKDPLDRSRFLTQCGKEISSSEYFKIYSIIEKTLSKEPKELSEKRKEMYRYTFGEEKNFQTLRQEIYDICKSPKIVGPSYYLPRLYLS